MRAPVFLFALLLPATALAQSQTPGTTTHGPVTAQTPTTTPAPVPAITPPTAQSGAPSTVPEQVSPPGIGNNQAGPLNATPFSSSPTDAMPSTRQGTAPDVSR